MSGRPDNVLASRSVLMAMKDRLTAARRGHGLLKRKSDAIKMNLNLILREILTVKRRVGGAVRNANFAHTEAVWAAGDINAQVIAQQPARATYRVEAGIKNVAGVKLPTFHLSHQTKSAPDAAAPAQAGAMIGLSSGGQMVVKCRQVFTSTLDDLVALASLQTSLQTLDEALKVTNRRVNALEFVVVPRLVATVAYIIGELDEQEREDQFRIKKVKGLRQQADQKERAMRKRAVQEAKVELKKVKQEVAGMHLGQGLSEAKDSALDAFETHAANDPDSVVDLF